MTFEDCPAAELAEAIGQLHALECAVHRQMLGAIAAFDEKEGWREDGASSVVPWLVAALGVSHSTAAGWARTAHELEGLPAVAAAYGEGRLSADQLAPVLRIATPENEEELVEAAVGWSAAEARAIARKVRPKAEVGAPSSLRWWRDGDDEDVLHLRGRLRGEAGAVVAARLEEETARVPGDEPFDVRAAEALAALAAARGKAEAGRASVVVHADAETLLSGEGAAPVEGGGEVSAETLRRLACDGRWRLFAHGPDGSVVGVHRASRVPPPWLVRLVRRRDKGCRFPACGRTRWTHCHHVTFWAEGGPTDLANLALLCSYHHKVVHEGGWRIEGDPNGELRFVRPDGVVFTTGPPPLDPEVRKRILGDPEVT